MKKTVFLFLLILLVSISTQARPARHAQHTRRPRRAHHLPASNPYCDSKLWDYVYGPERFDGPHRCTRVIGQVVRAGPDGRDGDYKLHITLDMNPTAAKALGYINEKNLNLSTHKYELIVEFPCVVDVKAPVTGPGAIPKAHWACAASKAIYPTPRYSKKTLDAFNGHKVLIEGLLVRDSGTRTDAHGNIGPGHGWMEIHPATTIMLKP